MLASGAGRYGRAACSPQEAGASAGFAISPYNSCYAGFLPRVTYTSDDAERTRKQMHGRLASGEIDFLDYHNIFSAAASARCAPRSAYADALDGASLGVLGAWRLAIRFRCCRCRKARQRVLPPYILATADDRAAPLLSSLAPPMRPRRIFRARDQAIA